MVGSIIGGSSAVALAAHGDHANWCSCLIRGSILLGIWAATILFAVDARAEKDVPFEGFVLDVALGAGYSLGRYAYDGMAYSDYGEPVGELKLDVGVMGPAFSLALNTRLRNHPSHRARGRPRSGRAIRIALRGHSRRDPWVSGLVSFRRRHLTTGTDWVRDSLCTRLPAGGTPCEHL